MAQIKWIPGNGDFATAANWMGGTVPGPADDAIFQGTGYTVTSSISETVNSLQMTAGVTLDINGGTFLASTGSGTGTLAGLIVTADNTNFEAGGTIAGSGTISLGGTYYGSTFYINSAVTTLSGGGKVILNDGINRIQAATSGAQLVNASDTIQGDGQLGNGNMAFANGAAGVVNGNSGVGALVLNFGTYGGTNAGLIEATNSAGLTIYNTAITQSGTGTLKAIGSGNNLYLQSASITGGALTTTTGGQIQDVSAAELNGVKLTTGSTLVGLDNTTMGWDNTINNAGTFAQNGTYYGTHLYIDTATVTLTGGGKLQLLDGNIVNHIEAGIANAKLVNVNNTISGSGLIGNGSTLGLDNQRLGIINSNGTTGLTLNTPGVVTNEGLIEDTGTGGFGLSATTITNTGTIAANGAGSHIDIYGGARIVGGQLVTTAGGVIQSAGDGTLDGSTVGNAITITSGSTVQLLDNTSLELNGAIVNHGTLLQNATYYGTSLVINTPTVTLSGAGTLLMSQDGNNNNRILAIAAGSKLVNIDNTITGSGKIGNGTTLAIDNKAAGIIDATGTTTNNDLTFNTAGVNVSNEGLLEDTGVGGLGFYATNVNNTGTIAAYGAGSFVNFDNGSSIIGGTLVTSGGGVIETTDTGTLDGLTAGAVTITAGSIVQVNDYNAALSLNGSIVNDGTIFENGFYYGSYLVANSPTVTLTGAGHVILADYVNNNSRITAGAAGDKLVNVNNTISGSGQFGNATTLAIDNQAAGIINSNGSYGLTFNTAGAVTNEGLIEDTGPGGIGLNGTIIRNTGTIAAFGTNTFVDFYNGASIIGGTLATTSNGVIDTSNTGTLDGLTAGAITITAGSTVEVLDNNDALYLNGAIVNNGTIFENGSYYGSYIVANSATVTLTGGGHVVLADYVNNNSRVTAAVAGDKLVNVNNTISGSGQFGNNTGLVIDNQAAGIINSNGLYGMVFYTAGPFTNEGLIEATNTGGITFNSTSVTNTGTIAAIGAGVPINVYNNSAIVGGTIAASGGGYFETTNNGTLDGSTATGPLTLTAGTEFIVGDNNDTLEINGAIVNHGTIFVDSTYYGSYLVINTPTVTLSGGGQILLSDNSNNNARITTAATGNTLVNVDNTILGAGQFGNTGALNIDNQAAATIDASATQQLNINIGGAALTNEGLLEATGAGGLLVQNATLTNIGTIAAMLDSTATIAASTTLTNLNAGGTLTGGTYAAISSATAGHFATLTIAAGPVVVDAAKIIESGIGSSVTFGGVAVDSSLTTIAAGGELDILNGRQFTAAGPLADNGLILVNTAGTLAAPAISVGATGTIATTSGTGTIAPTGTLTNAGLLQASNGGTLVLSTGTLTSTGTISALAASTLSILSTATDQNLSGSGVLTGGTWQAIGNGATLLLTGAVVSTDRATITLSGLGSVFKSGTTTANRTLESSLTSVASNGVLNLLAGRSFASTTASLSDTGLITLAGGTLTASALSIGGTLSGYGSIGSPATLNGTLTANGGTLTTTGALTGTGLLNVHNAATLNATAGFAIGSIVIANNGTLNGSGTVSGSVTDNGTFNTGTLSVASLTLSATGTITATTITASGSITDAGTINLAGGTLSGAGGLTVSSTGTLSGTGTIIQPLQLDGQLTATSGVLNANGLISGAGTITAAAGSLLFTNAGYAVGAVTVAATGHLVGSGSTTGAITVGGVISGSVTGSGSITILATGGIGGTTIISSGAISDAGTITLEGGTLSGASITVTSTGLLDNFGTVAQQVANSGTISAAGGTLTLVQGEVGGALAAQSTGTLLAQAAVAATSLDVQTNAAFTGFGSVTGATTNAGTITAQGGTLTLAGESGGALVAAANATLTSTAAIAAASLTVNAGATFAGFGTTAAATNAGTITALGGTLTLPGGAVGGALAATTGGTLVATTAISAASLTTAAGGTFAGAATLSGAVTDAGTINAGAGTLSAHIVNIQPGGVLNGASVIASGTLADHGTINLAGGTLSASAISLNSVGAIIGAGTIAQTVTNGGSITASGGTLTLAAGETGGTLHALSGATLASTTAIAAASLKIDAGGKFLGFGTVSGATTDAGALTVTSGSLVLGGALTGTGNATIDTGATLSLSAGLTLKGGLTFAAGSNEILSLGKGTGNSGSIHGFANGTTIDLRTIAATGETYSASTHTLTLTNGATTVATLKFAGAYSTNSFHLQSDGGTGTDITYTGLAAMADLHAAITAAATAPAQPQTPVSASFAAAPTTIPAAPEFNLTPSTLLDTALSPHTGH